MGKTQLLDEKFEAYRLKHTLLLELALIAEQLSQINDYELPVRVPPLIEEARRIILESK